MTNNIIDRPEYMGHMYTSLNPNENQLEVTSETNSWSTN